MLNSRKPIVINVVGENCVIIAQIVRSAPAQKGCGRGPSDEIIRKQTFECIHIVGYGCLGGAPKGITENGSRIRRSRDSICCDREHRSPRVCTSPDVRRACISIHHITAQNAVENTHISTSCSDRSDADHIDVDCLTILVIGCWWISRSSRTCRTGIVDCFQASDSVFCKRVQNIKILRWNCANRSCRRKPR